MQFLHLWRPLKRVATGCKPSVLRTCLVNRLVQLCHDGHEIEGRRYASVRSQGAYKKKPKRTIPKKLGAKKTGDQYVIPGNIIYKQRGTVWYPGENAHMGRDHTIHASVAGYVKYYRDPLRHPRRQFIGVTFTRDEKLPYAPGLPRKRKLDLAAYPRKPAPAEDDVMGPSGIPRYVVRHGDDEDLVDAIAKAPSRKAALILEYRRAKALREGTRVLRLQDDYGYRESNWEIGRLVGPVGKVGGTSKGSSRRVVLRNRRWRRRVEFGRRVALARERRERAADAIARIAEKRLEKHREHREFKRQEWLKHMKENQEDQERLAALAGEKSQGEKDAGDTSVSEKSEE